MRSWAVREAAPVRPHRHAGARPVRPAATCRRAAAPLCGFAVTAELPLLKLKHTTADALLDVNRTLASGEVLLSPAATSSLITRTYNRSSLPLCSFSAGTLGRQGRQAGGQLRRAMSATCCRSSWAVPPAAWTAMPFATVMR